MSNLETLMAFLKQLVYKNMGASYHITNNAHLQARTCPLLNFPYAVNVHGEGAYLLLLKISATRKYKICQLQTSDPFKHKSQLT